MYVISQILLSIPITDEITDLILTYILDIHITCNMFFDKCAPKIYIPAKHTSFIVDAELTPIQTLYILLQNSRSNFIRSMIMPCLRRIVSTFSH